MVSRRTILGALAGFPLLGLASACSSSSTSGTGGSGTTPDSGSGDKDSGPTSKSDSGSSSGDSGLDASAQGECTTGGTATSMTGHSGHVLTVPVADLTSTADKTYSIMGASAHDHSVTITPAQFALLKQRQTFTVTSTTGSGHTHDVTVGCA